MTNHQDSTSGKKVELETHRDIGNKEEQKRESKEDCSSDAEYESFGETIDENDNFEDLDRLLEDDSQKFESNILKVSLQRNKVSSNANIDHRLSKVLSTEPQNPLSSYVHQLDMKRIGIATAYDKSVSSADSFSSSNSSNVENRKKREKDVSMKETLNSERSPSSWPSQGGYLVQARKRSEGKREAWVTSPKASHKDHDKLLNNVFNKSVVQNVPFFDDSKQLQVRVTRLSKGTLKQHGYDSKLANHYPISFSKRNEMSNTDKKYGERKGETKSRTELSNTFKTSNLNDKTKTRCLINSSIVTKEFKRKRTFSDSTEFSARIHSYSSYKSSNAIETPKVKRRKRKEHSSRVLHRYKSQKSPYLSSSESEKEDVVKSRGKLDIVLRLICMIFKDTVVLYLLIYLYHDRTGHKIQRIKTYSKCRCQSNTEGK